MTNIHSIDWSKQTTNLIIDLPFIEGTPSPEKAQAINRWVLDNKNLNANKFVRFYHGTDPSLPIEDEGLKPTTAKRRRSYQSKSGFVYLANTPERAENFGLLGNRGRCVVYEVIVPVRSLRADLDQLNNQRATGRYGELGDSIGESVVYGGGVRIKGALEPWQVCKLTQEQLPRPTWPTQEELLRLWFDSAPTHRSPYGLYGYPPMWETLRHGDLVLYTRPAKTQDRPAPFMPYVEVDGLQYQWQRNGFWVGQGCSTTFDYFHKNGASKVEIDLVSSKPAQQLPNEYSHR
jgi:hypothetical protein